ncbi:PREDICTED: aminopeptidase O [Nanorana parkeri]|uniref:aminopeptidase O n=1 Tax=Nanorana parkeri TaxID=125878 RepID=UPI0008546E17|nr:PREDICTED: aminopeptidase O [Nanorana parkeri]
MDQDADDLPLMANTSQILVKHFALDLDVNFDSQTLSGSVVLFLHPAFAGEVTTSKAQLAEANEVQRCESPMPQLNICPSHSNVKDATLRDIGERDTSDKCDHHGNRKQTTEITSSGNCCDRRNHGSADFVLVLDCCDLAVLKVEEVDVTAVPVTTNYMCSTQTSHGSKQQLPDTLNMPPELEASPASRWKDQLSYYMQCSQAPGCGELIFVTDSWSLQIRKAGVKMPCAFPSAVRMWYKTTANGRSVKWTKDQSGRPCVYTFGSPINNRALFPCQEPPVAMSTWHATVRADSTFIVLMSGENFAAPANCEQGLNSWFYYVTMPMPASTFTIAVGVWTEVKENSSVETYNLSHYTPLNANDGSRSSGQDCNHMEYPCRYSIPEAHTQMCIPHRVFAPDVLLDRCKELLLPLLPHCLKAAYSVMGVHPFSRLDVLIVPPDFSSLGMASPHIIYLSQSVLSGRKQLCMTRVSHEIAHAWFGLAIGARDWTEEWISEGFATHLEDVFSAEVQKLSEEEAREQHELKALLRWCRLSDELKNSQQELQILRPQGDSTGEVSDSGASVVRHGLNADKAFMQVHYLKGYFLLRYLANIMGQEAYFSFLKKFVTKFHRQLILSQDFLHMLLNHFPEQNKHGLSVELLYKIWLDTPGMPQPLLEESQAWDEKRLVQQVREEVSKWTRLNKRNRRSTGRKRQHEEEFHNQILPDQLVLLLDLLLQENTLCAKTLQCLKTTYSLQEHDAEVRHRWCELVIKHKYTAAYKDVEIFLLQDQAMGVYLYGELMLNEDARQQELAHRCFAVVRDQMDVSCVKVVREMLF